MKHIFIVNPTAGTRDRYDEIARALEPMRGEIDYEIYRTAYPKDATRYVRQMCLDNPGYPLFVSMPAAATERSTRSCRA